MADSIKGTPQLIIGQSGKSAGVTPLWAKVGTIWKQVKPYALKNGIWKEIVGCYSLKNGVWVDAHCQESVDPPTFPLLTDVTVNEGGSEGIFDSRVSPSSAEVSWEMEDSSLGWIPVSSGLTLTLQSTLILNGIRVRFSATTPGNSPVVSNIATYHVTAAPHNTGIKANGLYWDLTGI